MALARCREFPYNVDTRTEVLSVKEEPAMRDEMPLDQTCINTIRFLSADAVQKANSGHPGAPMGAAPMAYVLWDRFLKHNPRNPHWPDRDRFVLSAGRLCCSTRFST